MESSRMIMEEVEGNTVKKPKLKNTLIIIAVIVLALIPLGFYLDHLCHNYMHSIMG